MAVVRAAPNRPLVQVFDDYGKYSKHVAVKIANIIKTNERGKVRKKTVLGLATGSSPLGVYRELIKMYKQRSIDFSDCVFFNLDEYTDLASTDLQSYYRFMKENFFEHINAREEQINVPNGSIVKYGGDATSAFCQEYEAKIKGLGGIDLQILGLGRNGHIGFNEPGSHVDSRTRVVRLLDSTRKDAAPDFFGMQNVPNTAITMGVGTILEAKEIILLVSGEHKASILKSSLEGPPNSRVPASYLQYHDNVEVISDRNAASMLLECSAPWLVRDDISWKIEKKLSQSAMIWLARRKRKTLDDLDSDDFKLEHLNTLLSYHGENFGKELLKEFGSKINNLDTLIRKKTRKTRNKALILSPHPDDDVICMGATMQKLSAGGYNLNVAYMVSGSNAVKDLDVLNYLNLKNSRAVEMVLEYGSKRSLDYEEARKEIIHSIFTKQKGAPDELIVRKIKQEIRRQEAIRASSKAGQKAHFLNLPFYEEYGSPRKAPISEEDVDIVRRFLFELRPDVIFLAGDTTDPNGTHSLCMDAFHTAFSSLKRLARSEEEKEYASRLSHVPLLLYRGAWQEFTLEEADSIELFDISQMESKIEMILEHVSQIDPLFPGPYDDRQFWERARDRNTSFVDSCKALGLRIDDGIGAEVYKIARA